MDISRNYVSKYIVQVCLFISFLFAIWALNFRALRFYFTESGFWAHAVIGELKHIIILILISVVFLFSKRIGWSFFGIYIFVIIAIIMASVTSFGITNIHFISPVQLLTFVIMAIVINLRTIKYVTTQMRIINLIIAFLIGFSVYIMMYQ
jgi:hypothetical protein